MNTIIINILLIIVSIIFSGLVVAGFLVFYKFHEADPLTPEQAKEIRESYEKKAEEEREYYKKNPALAAASPIAICNPMISLEPSVHNFINAGPDFHDERRH
jgi:flagellar basal body-associated protein FliL